MATADVGRLQARIEELSESLSTSDAALLAAREEARAAERRAKVMQTRLSERAAFEADADAKAERQAAELEAERLRSARLDAELRQARSQAAQQSSAAVAEDASEAESLRSALARAETQLADLRRTLSDRDSALALLRDESTEAVAELERLSAVEVRSTALEAELVALQQDNTVNCLAELQWQNAQLSSSLQEASMQIEALQESNAHEHLLLAGLQARSEGLERELAESRLPQRSPRPFESLADDEVLEDLPTPTVTPNRGGPLSPLALVSPRTAASASGTPASLPPPHPHSGALFTPTRTPAVFDPTSARKGTPGLTAEEAAAAEAFAAEQELLCVARIAAETAPTAPHSSLASGSASLAYASAAAFSPARRAMPIQSASPGLHARPSRGIGGFISSLLPGSGSSASAAAAAVLQSSPTAGRSSSATTSFTPSGTPIALLQYPPPSPAARPPMDSSSAQSTPATRERTSSHSSTPSPQRPVGQRDADFEFFALTLLCVKIHCGKKMESLYTISTQDLWNKAKREGIQFHQYYGWLEDELTRAYVSKLSSVRKESAGSLLEREGDLDSYLPSNSAVKHSARSRTASSAGPGAAAMPGSNNNTAAARMHMQPSSVTSAGSTGGLDAVKSAAAAAVRALNGGSIAAAAAAPSQPQGLAVALQAIPLTPSRARTASNGDSSDAPLSSPQPLPAP